jgi:tetratricopeptide (TPR) repeat protein
VGKEDATISSLRAAMAVSPENVPLRAHLAQVLLAAGLPTHAVQEYKEALKRSPRDITLKLGLAQSYLAARDLSTALVIAEEMLGMDAPPPSAHVLHARILLARGEADRALRAYREGVGADPALADPHLARELELASLEEEPAAADAEAEAEDRGGRVPDSSPVRGTAGPFSLERPTVTFAEVGGMEKLKEEIRLKIIHPISHAELYKAYGKPIGGGILMYGPPGCGKTYLARATAGEVKASFLAVGINDVLDMWLGNSERNLHELFETARRNAPCVMFFDEVDALGAMIINQFLSELDGVRSSNEGVLILAATNAPWHLDGAFRRPGRFDQILFVPPPDAEARARIFQVILAGKPLGKIDYAALARQTESFSGADLKAVVDRATDCKFREAMKSGLPQPLTNDDLLRAARSARPTVREWFSTARNYAVYANQAGLYDDILHWLNEH